MDRAAASSNAGEEDTTRGTPFELHGDEPPVLLGSNRGPTGTVSSSSATEEQFTELCQYVQDTSPVRDVIANPVPVETSLRVQ